MSRPGNTRRELDFIHFWKPYVRFFQFLCISHHGIFRPDLKDQRIKLISLRIFSIVNVSIQIVVSAYFFVCMGTERKLRVVDKFNVSPLFIYVNVGTRFCQLLSFLVIPVEMFFHSHVEHKIFETLQSIDDIFQKMNFSIDYGIHRRQQMRKTWLLFTVITIAMIFAYVVNFAIDTLLDLFGILLYSYIFIVWRMRVFQILFFINAVFDLLGEPELKVVMRRQQHRLKYNSAHWKDIQYARKIYSKIWFLKTLISDCFGYSMVLIIVDSAVKIINTGYWFYMDEGSLETITLFSRQYKTCTTSAFTYTYSI